MQYEIDFDLTPPPIEPEPKRRANRVIGRVFRPRRGRIGAGACRRAFPSKVRGPRRRGAHRVRSFAHQHLGIDGTVADDLIVVARNHVPSGSTHCNAARGRRDLRAPTCSATARIEVEHVGFGRSRRSARRCVSEVAGIGRWPEVHVHRCARAYGRLEDDDRNLRGAARAKTRGRPPCLNVRLPIGRRGSRNERLGIPADLILREVAGHDPLPRALTGPALVLQRDLVRERK